MTRAKGCISGSVIFLLLLLVGVGISYYGWTILDRARASASWPSVSGQVTRAYVDYSTDAEGADSYQPVLVYAYTVADQTFVNSRIKFGENSYSSERPAREIVDRYPAGTRVFVYHDPADPGESVLEPGVSGGSYLVLGIGLLLVAISLATLPFTLWQIMRRKA